MLLKKVAKNAVKALNKLTPITGKESRFLESLLEKRFLHFGVEPTNACNANCPYCAYRFSEKIKKIMPMEIHKKVVEEYNALGGGPIALTPTIGDPLMDRTIIDKIKVARSYPNITNIFFYTNLVNLNNFDVNELLLSGISRISVSTAIGSREMYSRLFGVDKYGLMLSNLKKLLEANRALDNPVDIVLALRFDKNFDIDNNDDYKNILGLIDKKKITKLPNERGYDNWGGVIEEKDLPKEAVFRRSKVSRTEPCAELYRRVNILADGDVNFCVCRDFNYELVIGNINENSLIDIWNGEKMKNLRSEWKAGAVPDICRNCSSYEPLSGYLKKTRLAIWALWKRMKR